MWLEGTEGRERLIYDGGLASDKHTDRPFMKELCLFPLLVLFFLKEHTREDESSGGSPEVGGG